MHDIYLVIHKLTITNKKAPTIFIEAFFFKLILGAVDLSRLTFVRAKRALIAESSV